MTTNTTNDAIVLRDQAGTFYLLTPTILKAALAAPEQQAELRRRHGDDVAGFSFTLDPFGFFTVLFPAASSKPVALVESGRGQGSGKVVAEAPGLVRGNGQIRGR